MIKCQFLPFFARRIGNLVGLTITREYEPPEDIAICGSNQWNRATIRKSLLNFWRLAMRFRSWQLRCSESIVGKAVFGCRLNCTTTKDVLLNLFSSQFLMPINLTWLLNSFYRILRWALFRRRDTMISKWIIIPSLKNIFSGKEFLHNNRCWFYEHHSK